MAPRPIDLAALRRYAVARSLFELPLAAAIERLGFVQADPIRAPARAQDLTLRLRVPGYVAGDLEAKYPTLEVEEEHFINYGFLPRAHGALLHPRRSRRPWTRTMTKRAAEILELVRDRGEVHPRDVDAELEHGTITNYWGGTSSASTHLLERMHFRGMVRVARREGGIRIYALANHEPSPRAPAAVTDALVGLLLRKYAPIPLPTFGALVGRLRYAVPHLVSELRPAIARARATSARATVDGVEWLWPADESPRAAEERDGVRFLAPFDPIVWDRRRFEMLWGWPYRFEAYVPAKKRLRGYYALPVLWREHALGWANAAVSEGELRIELGFTSGAAPRERAFARACEAEVGRLRAFLALPQRRERGGGASLIVAAKTSNSSPQEPRSRSSRSPQRSSSKRGTLS